MRQHFTGIYGRVLRGMLMFFFEVHIYFGGFRAHYIFVKTRYRVKNLRKLREFSLPELCRGGVSQENKVPIPPSSPSLYRGIGLIGKVLGIL